MRKIVLGITIFLVLFVGLTSVSFASFPGSPNFQLESGVSSRDVKCNEGKVLFFKTTTFLPICIFTNSFTTLEQRNYILPNFDVLLDQIIYVSYDNSVNSHPIHHIKYTMDNGKVLSMIKEYDKEYLDISIIAKDNGILYVELPRDFLDALIPGVFRDDSFIVLLDGSEILFQEIYTTSISRILKINFNADSQLIEIFGVR